MQASNGSASTSAKRAVIVILVALAVGLATYLVSAEHRPTYRNPGGDYTVQYPPTWTPVKSGGLVVFRPKAAPSAEQASVTIVVSAMKPDWDRDFETALAKGLTDAGHQFALLGHSTRSTPHGPVKAYDYSLTFQGKKLQNTVFVFVLGKDKAAVMTCSGPEPRSAALAARFQIFTDTFATP